MREKAPGSGGPAAGNPEGVKSGRKLFEEVKAQVQGDAPAVDPADAPAPAVADIRPINADGSSNSDPAAEIHSDTREQADAVVAKEADKAAALDDDQDDHPHRRRAKK